MALVFIKQLDFEFSAFLLGCSQAFFKRQL
jgi:hypothetical protein